MSIMGTTGMRGRWKRPDAVELHRTHGLSGHSLYMTWLGMMHRCYDEKARGWENYGGRGIAVSPAWHDVAGFISAVEREIGLRPTGCTLDRIDNDGDYRPGNIRWATNSQQQRNARPRRLLRGSRMGPAKLTEEIVAECRRRAAEGESQEALAREFGVGGPTMNKAVRGETWRHVQVPPVHTGHVGRPHRWRVQPSPEGNRQ